MGLNQALVVHFRFKACQIRGSIIKRHPDGVFFMGEEKDWKTAAKEASERKDVQKARREWTKLMFLNAN